MKAIDTKRVFMFGYRFLFDKFKGLDLAASDESWNCEPAKFDF